MPALVQIVSPDPAFAESIGSHVHGWGLSVAIERELGHIPPPARRGRQVDVVLLDVRRPGDGVLGWLASLKRALPALEVILLTEAGRISVAIEGMRAGASDELSAPLDLAALRRSLFAALARRERRLRRAGASLLARFERAMSAVAFAEAGEQETARELLAGDGAARRRGKRNGGRE
jgi:DNA-binding NtrC family response regulator